jgi:uncharacterized protein YfiM (DUF2279 family)
MDRDQFHAKLAGYDADQLGRILWTLYWRGSAPMRERIEALLDPDAHARQQRRKVEPPEAAVVHEEAREFVALARAGAYLAGDRRVSPKERTRWRFTFRRLAGDAQAALVGDDVDTAVAALELLVDLACETRGYEYFRSDDPMQAAGFVISDAAAALWRAVRDRHGFAAFTQRAAAQLLRWETGHGWTRYGFGSVAAQETSLAAVVEELLQAPDHWRVFATRYLEALDEADDRTPGTPRHRSRATGRDREARARALADWHALLVDRLIGSEDEPLLDRLVGHRALAGPERSFLQAQLAHRRGDDETARQLVHDSLDRLPGHPDFHDLARRIGAPLPPRAQQVRTARR